MKRMAKVDKVYQDLLKDILENGAQKGDRTGTGTVSVFGRMIRFNMADGFPMLTTKKMFMRGIINELLWFLDGETNITSLIENDVFIWNGDAYKRYKTTYEKINAEMTNGSVEILSQTEFVDRIKTDSSFAGKWGDLGPVYGKQWVDWGGYEIVSGDEIQGLNKGVNQIQKAIDMLKDNPNSRRIMVSAWNVSDLDKMTLPPCHYGFQLNTTELSARDRQNISTNYGNTNNVEANWDVGDGMIHGVCDKWGVPRYKLSLMWNQRSVDTFLGLPFNITSYALLLHMIAQQVNMVPHELIGSLGDTHLYNNHMKQVEELLSREPMELPTLELEKADSIFDYCYENVKILNYSSHPAIKAPLSN